MMMQGTSAIAARRKLSRALLRIVVPLATLAGLLSLFLPPSPLPPFGVDFRLIRRAFEPSSSLTILNKIDSKL